MGTRPAIFGATSKSQIWISGEARHTKTISTILIGQEDSSMRGGEMRLCTASLSGFLRTRARSTGKSLHVKNSELSYWGSLSPNLQGVVTLSGHLKLTFARRFRDIGYQHIPFFNCPNSPKCSGCVTGRLTDGESWLHQEDCRPNWFKYVGMD